MDTINFEINRCREWRPPEILHGPCNAYSLNWHATIANEMDRRIMDEHNRAAIWENYRRMAPADGGR